MIHGSNMRRSAIVGIGTSTGASPVMKEYSLKLQVAGRRALLASQHMPVGTTRPLAKSLYSSSKWPVLETNMGRKAKAGEAFIIRDPGDLQ